MRLRRVALRDLVDGLGLWELWGRLCWNEVRRRYRRTLLGPMWVTVSLGIFAVILSFVWAALFKLDVNQYLPFLLSGLIPWMMIAACLGESCTVFLGSEALMKSRQFPYSVLTYVVVARNAVIFGHNLVTYFLAALFCGVAFNLNMLAALPGFALLVLNLGWMCLLTAILCLRFRDVHQLILIVLQVAMLVTPVFWPVEQLTGKRAIIVDGNILYHMIDIIRTPLLGEAAGAHSYFVSAGLAVAGWLFTALLFAKKRHRLVYWF